MASHFEVLGVPPDASLEEITRAYRVRARLLHPDHHADEPADVQAAARAQFELVAAAYRALTQSTRSERSTWSRADETERPAPQPKDPPRPPDASCLDPKTWLAKAAVAGTASAPAIDADPALRDTVADLIYRDMVARLVVAPSGYGDEAAAALAAYDAASKSFVAATAGPFGFTAAEILMMCTWSACRALWNEMPADARAHRKSPPSQPGQLIGTTKPGGTTPCKVCANAPTRLFDFHAIRGRVVWWSDQSVKGPLCRDCALSLGRHAQAVTLNHGWWGLVSFFWTLVSIITNGLDLRAASGLGRPYGLGRSLDPGPPVFDRRMFGLLLALSIVGLVVWVSISGSGKL